MGVRVPLFALIVRNFVNQRYCPCGSQQNYLLCCAPFHKGKIVSNATQLLRARFSAYALNLPRFIIETTHPDNPQYQRDFRDWEKKISSFSSDFLFEGVEILADDSTPLGLHFLPQTGLHFLRSFFSFTRVILIFKF